MVENTGQRPSFRRRNYLINRSYQLSWAIGLVLVALGVMVLTALVCAFFFLYIYPGGPQIETSGHRLYVLLLVLWFGVCACVLVLAGVLLTHRTAGPMYRFRTIFHQIEAGDMKARVHLRKNDNWHDVAAAFNQAMDVIERRNDSIREGMSELRQTLENYRQDKSSDTAVKKMVDLVSDLHDVL